MVNLEEQVANISGTPTVIKRLPPETRVERLEKLRGVSPEETIARQERIRGIGVATETTGIRRIEEPSEVKFAKAVTALAPAPPPAPLPSPEVQRQRRERIRGVSPEETIARQERIRGVGIGTETPGIRRIEEPSDVKFAKAASALMSGVSQQDVLDRLAMADTRVEKKAPVAAAPLATSVTPLPAMPLKKEFMVQTTPAGQFLVVETQEGKRFIPGIVPEIVKQSESIVAGGETPENFNVVVARFLESEEGKKFVKESGMTREQLVKISRREEITTALQEDIRSGRLERTLREQAAAGDVGAAVTLAGRELIIGRQVGRLVGDEEFAARAEAEFLTGLQTSVERRDPLAFAATSLGETISGQLGVGIAAGAGIGAAGVVAGTAFKGSRVAAAASKVPVLAKAGAFLAKPSVQKTLVVGAVGGIEAAKVSIAVGRGEPVAKIGTELTKYILFLGGTVAGVKAGIAAAKAPVTTGKIEFTSKAFGRQFQTGVPSRIAGIVKTRATLLPPRTRAEALLRKAPKEVTFGVKEGFISRIEGQDVSTLFLKPGKPIIARPTITRTIAELKPPGPLGITTRRIAVIKGPAAAEIGQATTLP